MIRSVRYTRSTSRNVNQASKPSNKTSNRLMQSINSIETERPCSPRITNRWLPYAIGTFIVAAHLGASEYLSFMFSGFILLLLYIATTSMSRRAVVISALLFVAQIITILISHRSDNVHLMLSVTRESLVILTLLHVLIYFPKWFKGESKVIISKSIYVTITANIVFASIQAFDSLSFNSGIADLPKSFYALEYGTLLSTLREKYADYGIFLRPSALYSEPSTLGMIGVVCSIAGVKLQDRKILISSSILVAISFSLSAYISFIASFALTHIKNKNISYLIILALTISALSYTALPRLEKAYQGDDLSTNLRLFTGVEIIKSNLDTGRYLGVSENDARFLGYQLTGQHNVLDNYIFYKLIVFGVFGIVFFIALYLIFGREIFTYILLFGFINGTLFYYDRLLLISLLFAALSFSWKPGLLMRRARK